MGEKFSRKFYEMYIVYINHVHQYHSAKKLEFRDHLKE